MRISVNVQEVAQGARYLYQKAQEYQQLIDQIDMRMHQMEAFWQGEDHQAFINRLENFRPTLHKMTSVIEDYAQYLYYSASVYQQIQQDRIVKASSLA